MIFNGSCIFSTIYCQFSMLANGNLSLEKLPGGYVHTDGHMEIHPCVLQDNGPLRPLPKKLISAILFKWQCQNVTDFSHAFVFKERQNIHKFEG